MIDFLLLIVGLIVLVIGGDLLVRGAVSIAEKLAIPTLIIGLTIVSFGTSAPELFISVQAALAGSGGIAIGNVVGSNIANVLLVLGLPALITMTSCAEKGIGRNILIMIGITVVFMGMLAKGVMGFVDGSILIALLSLFLWDQYRSAKMKPEGELPDYHDEVSVVHGSKLLAIGMLIAGLVLLPFAAWITVDSAQSIASRLGVSDEIIGLTIVAIGTSLPELSASLMAVIRGNSNVAIGNVIGSNIFNIAAIMGVTTIITPVGVGPHIISVDMWIMLATALWLAWLAYYKKRISRRTGVLMSIAYIIFVVVAFIK